MTAYQDKALYVLDVRGREFLDSIYEPRDLTCFHCNENNPHAKERDVGIMLSIANAKNDGSFEFEAIELEYWQERPLVNLLTKTRPRKR